MKKIKVLLASYNGEAYIEEQIDSILMQKDVSVDIVVADDGSKDKTVDIIKKKYKNIDVKINIPAKGSAGGNFLQMLVDVDFNEDFDYIAFSDQDDIWLPQKLNAAINALNREKVDLYCSNLISWNMHNDTYSTLKKDFPQTTFDYLFESGSAGCTCVFSKKMAKEMKKFVLGIYLEDWIELSHDWLLYFFARSRGYKVFIDSNSYIYYRIHGNNVHGYLNQFSLNAVKKRISMVLNGYYQKQIRYFIKYVNTDTEEKKIYTSFLGGYFSRNFMILKYNFRLMRDRKKFYIFLLLNLIKL